MVTIVVSCTTSSNYDQLMVNKNEQKTNKRETVIAMYADSKKSITNTGDKQQQQQTSTTNTNPIYNENTSCDEFAATWARRAQQMTSEWLLLLVYP